MKEIQILEPLVPGEPSRFILALLKSENREIFHRLCLDIIESTRACNDEKEALARLIRRTWRWHAMLKGGRDERLSPESQKGLIGELRILELVLLPRFNAGEAIGFWHGPEGAPKDFAVGDIAIEAKAKRGASRDFVEISSEHQLDGQSLETLYLAVSYIDEGSVDMPESLSLSQYVNLVSDLVEKNDPGSLGYFESKLSEAGYSEEHDYGDTRWLIGQTRWFEVKDDFPRINHSGLPSGVSNVKYNLDLGACEALEISLTDVQSTIDGSFK